MSVTAADLGAWEDVPRRRTDVDVTQAPIDSRAAFVLTRIDGMTAILDICAMSGFGQRETLGMLVELYTHGLIEVQPAEGKRRPIKLRDRQRRSAEAARRDDRPTLPDFNGVEHADVHALRRAGPLFRVPGQPFAAPGQGRYGNHRFDKRKLLGRSPLTLEQRKEILFLSANLDALDHFEFFDVEPTAERRGIKKAYFAFSKRFHPDTVFRKDIGEYQPLIVQIFKRGTEIYEALSNDQALRETYARAIEARNAAYRGALEAERRKQEGSRREKLKAEAEKRKVALRERLANNTRHRRQSTVANPVAERLERAERYYKEGMAHYQSENFIPASNALRLAVSFDPKNERYRQAFEKVNERARQVKAEQYWKAGFLQESVGRPREALQSYLEAVEAWPRHDYCAHVAELLVEHVGDLRRAAELAEQAVAAEPQEVDYLLLLGRIYAEANLTKKAQGVFERVLDIDKKNDDAKQALKSIKRR